MNARNAIVGLSLAVAGLPVSQPAIGETRAVDSSSRAVAYHRSSPEVSARSPDRQPPRPDPRKLPPSPSEGNLRIAFAASAAKHKHDPVRPADVVIDVIAAYTQRAAAHYADIRSELIDLSIDLTNESFRSSNIGHVKLRLVHAYQTDYREEGTHFDHVWRFADKDDGYMDEVHRLRDAYAADVAVLFVDDEHGCGLATRVGADADEAFAVVHHACAAGSYTVAHEIGHLIGARHEFGYVNGTEWRDIMVSSESCGGCPRLPVWSSPTVFVKGEPVGTALHNNAAIIAGQAARVAAFRNRPSAMVAYQPE
jgi:metallopeptidase family M12-like protein